jgi:hypothetical protein
MIWDHVGALADGCLIRTVDAIEMNCTRDVELIDRPGIDNMDGIEALFRIDRLE